MIPRKVPSSNLPLSLPPSLKLRRTKKLRRTGQRIIKFQDSNFKSERRGKFEANFANRRELVDSDRSPGNFFISKVGYTLIWSDWAGFLLGRVGLIQSIAGPMYSGDNTTGCHIYMAPAPDGLSESAKGGELRPDTKISRPRKNFTLSYLDSPLVTFRYLEGTLHGKRGFGPGALDFGGAQSFLKRPPGGRGMSQNLFMA